MLQHFSKVLYFSASPKSKICCSLILLVLLILRHLCHLSVSWLLARFLPRRLLSLGQDKTGGFLTQYALVFRQQSQAVSSDSTKISFMVELLTSQALQWAQAVLKACPDLSYNDFLTKFRCDKVSL